MVRTRACSNLRYSWVTCVILSNFCKFPQLVLSTHPLLLYQTFVVLSNFCHFLTPCYLFIFTSPTHPINAPAVHTTSTILSPVLLCARSLRKYTFLNSIGVSTSHRAILIWGDRGMAGGFLEEQPVTFVGEHMPTPLASSDPLHYPSKPTYFVSLPLAWRPSTQSSIFSLLLAWRPLTLSSTFLVPFVWRLSGDPLFSPSSLNSHPFTSKWSLDSTQPPHLNIPLWGDSFSNSTHDFNVLSLLLDFFGTSSR